MSLHAKLIHLFPNHVNGDWELQDNGAGPYIAKWNRPEPQPPQAALNAVTQQQQDNAMEARDLDHGFNLSRKDKVLVKWIASRTGGGTPASILAELRAIWRNT